MSSAEIKVWENDLIDDKNFETATANDSVVSLQRTSALLKTLQHSFHATSVWTAGNDIPT